MFVVYLVFRLCLLISCVDVFPMSVRLNESLVAEKVIFGLDLFVKCRLVKPGKQHSKRLENPKLVTLE